MKPDSQTQNSKADTSSWEIPLADIPLYQGASLRSPCWIISLGQARRVLGIASTLAGYQWIHVTASSAGDNTRCLVEYDVWKNPTGAALPVNALKFRYPDGRDHGFFLHSQQEIIASVRGDQIIDGPVPKSGTPATFIADRPICQGRLVALETGTTVLVYTSRAEQPEPTGYHICAVRVHRHKAPHGGIRLYYAKHAEAWYYYAVPALP